MRDIIGPGNKEALTYDANGNPINSLGGALNSHDADVHTKLYNHFVVNDTGDTSTLDGSVSQGDTSIILIDATDFEIGNFIDMHSGILHIHHYRKIINKVSNTLTLDAPVDQDFASGSTIDEVTFNMNVNGSLGSPVIFNVSPRLEEVIHVNTLLISMIHDTDAADDLFGGEIALNNGLVVRQNFGSGEKRTIAIWRSNKDIKEDIGAANLIYSDKVGGGKRGTSGLWDFNRAGTVFRLDGNAGDVLEILNQDNQTAFTDIQIKFQGHPESVT